MANHAWCLRNVFRNIKASVRIIYKPLLLVFDRMMIWNEESDYHCETSEL